MKDQHKKISGYRDLSQEEIDLMNRIKAKGAELLELQADLVEMLTRQYNEKCEAVRVGEDVTGELIRFVDAEPHNWAAIGKTDIQTGVMALVRAVAQPGGGI